MVHIIIMNIYNSISYPNFIIVATFFVIYEYNQDIHIHNLTYSIVLVYSYTCICSYIIAVKHRGYAIKLSITIIYCIYSKFMINFNFKYIYI